MKKRRFAGIGVYGRYSVADLRPPEVAPGKRRGVLLVCQSAR